MRTNKRMIGLVSVLALAVCWAWSTAASAGLSDGLVGYWPLDEGSGTATADLSGNVNTGSLLKGAGSGVAPQWNASGKFGNCLSFDGISSYVDCGNGASLRPASAVTVAGWVKQSALSYYAPIAGFIYDQGSDESGYAILSWTTPTPSGYGGWIRMGANTDGGYMPRVTTGYTLGQWTHVVLTYNGSVTTLYVNGSANKQTSADTGNLDYNPQTTFKMGVFQAGDWWLPYSGLIDEVAVWNRALSQTEVDDLYNNGPLGQIAGVKIEETAGQTQVTEGGATDSYTVVLNAQPGLNVEITAAPSDAEIDIGGGAGAARILTFTSSNWDTAQTVTVTAVDDEVYEGKLYHVTTITHTVQSSDDDYNGASADSVEVQVEDNELTCGDWGYWPMDLNQDCYVNLLDYAEFALEWLKIGE